MGKITESQIRKDIRKMELGESIIIVGKEFVKTKKGMYSPSGHKYTINDIINYYNRG